MPELIIALPERIHESQQATRPDVARFVLEAITVEGYRQEVLSRGQVGELLGLSFPETKAFLKEHEAYLHYDEQDLEQDLRTLAGLKHAGRDRRRRH